MQHKGVKPAGRRGVYQIVFRMSLCVMLMALVACQSTPAPSTPVSVPLPPTVPAVPTAVPMTLVPLATPTLLPTLAITPTPVPVDLAKWQPYNDPDKTFSFRFPPDWSGRAYTQALTRTLIPLNLDTVWLRGPDGDMGPEFVLLYNWPSLDPTQPATNSTAWSSVEGLSKLFLYPNCMTTFDTPAPVEVAGEQTMGAKFLVQCDRLYAGYLVGVTRNRVNYGLLVDVVAENWDAWRPTFETMLASFTFER